MTEYDTTIVCKHGDNCPWLGIFRKYMNVEFMPEFLCDYLQKISDTCATKCNSNIEPVKEELCRFENVLRSSRDYIHDKLNEAKDISLEAMKVINDGGKIKQIKPLIGNIIATIDRMRNHNQYNYSAHFLRIRDKMFERPIVYQTRGKIGGKRRQRECDFEIDLGDDHTMIRNRSHKIDMEAVGTQSCPHSPCLWKQVWIFMQEMAGTTICTAMPFNLCLELRKISNVLNEKIVIDV